MPGLPATSAGCGLAEDGSLASSGGQLEDDDTIRSHLSLAFAQALRQAEHDSAAMASKKSPSCIAEEVYRKLCYDFPMVETDELDALALVMKSTLAVNGRFPFPVSPCFVAGLSYLAGSVKQPGATSSAACLDGSVDDSGDPRGDALATILACILVVALSRALAAAAADGGRLLRDYLGSYRVASEVDPSELEPHPMAPHAQAEAAPQGESEQLAEDSDSDWEPLEPSCRPPVYLPQDPLHAPLDDGNSLSEQELLDRLTSLSAHLRYKTLARHSVWADPSLALMDALLDLLTHLTSTGQPFQGPRAPPLRAYLALLGDRLGACPAGTGRMRDSLADVLPRVLHALSPATSSSPISGAVFFSSLMAKLESSPPLASGLLWPAVQEALPMLAVHLQAVVGKAALSAEEVTELEAGLHVLAFFVEAAPGNADVGPPLLQSGIFRDARTLFLRLGAAPAAEQLRRFLLLAVVASPTLARFNAAAFPPLSQLTSSPAFQHVHSPASLHAALWPMLLWAGKGAADEEQQAAHIVRDPLAGEASQNGIASAGALARLHRFLCLLHSVVTAAPGERTLWTRNGPLERALVETSARCVAALGAARGQGRHGTAGGATRAEVETAGISSHQEDNSIADNGQKGGRQELRRPEGVSKPCGEGRVDRRQDSKCDKVSTNLRSSAEEKVLELMPGVLRQLKALISHGKGGATGKSD